MRVQSGFPLLANLSATELILSSLSKRDGVTPFSKALGVYIRTLEIYEQIGLAQKAIEQVEEIFGTNKNFQVLLRPDNYIAFVSPEISLDELIVYLKEFIGY